MVTHVATGILGTAVYTRSGHLREPTTRRTAVVLAGTAIVATPVGVLMNALVSGRAFGLLLGTFAVLVAALVWYRDRDTDLCQLRTRPPASVLAGIGLAVAAAAGVVGVGGPMLTVPLLVALGVPVLAALASAQAQSVIIAAVGTVGYLAHGAIDWPLAVLIGIPELAGVVIGWKLAHTMPTRTLKFALITALLVMAPYLALHG